MRKLLSGALLLGLLGASAASAGEFEVLGGASYNAQEGTTSAGWLHYVGERPSGSAGNRWQPQFMLVGGALSSRDAPGYDTQALLGGGVRLRHVDAAGSPSPWFAEGLLLSNSRSTPALSGHVQFGTGIGYEIGRYRLVLRHISNAGLKEPNGGETMLLFGAAFSAF